MDEVRLREEVKSMVLFINGSRPRPETPEKYDTISFMGTIILAEPQFCYVVVDRAMVRNGFSYEAKLPDGSVLPLLHNQFLVGKKGQLAAFYIYRNAVNYNVNSINAVQFGEKEVSRFDVVRLADFDDRQNIYFPRARVNHVEGHFFMLDWSSENIGAPVFNETGALVGICYPSLLEPSYACTLSALEAQLLELSEVPVQTFEGFLDQVRLRGAA